MRRVKDRFQRVLAGVLSFLIVLSCLSVLSTLSWHTVKAQDNTGLFVKSYFIELIYGAQKENEKFVWNAEGSDPGHQFAYRINYEISGEGEIEKGKLNIAVPRCILTDRDGNYADTYELSIPSMNEADESGEDNIKFVYYEDPDNDNNLIITNYMNISSAQNGFIELGYSTSKTTFYYTDMAPSQPFWADMTIERNNDSVSVSSERIPVYINTSAAITASQKYSTNNLYRSWQSEWGKRPANYNDYYYLIWRIESHVSATQPYNFTINDYFDQADIEVVGYKLSGETAFSDKQTDEFSMYVGKRIDYVLTRHLKAAYGDDHTYDITNYETAVVVPYDRIDSETNAPSSAVYTYTPAVFVQPIGGTTAVKYGNNNWPHYWPVANYALNDLQEGYVDHLNGNIKFYIGLGSYPYPYTAETGADMNDPESYGKKNVNYALTDERFYLEQPISSVNDVVNGTEEVRQLTSEDYEIEYVDYGIYMIDAYYDGVFKKFVTKSVEYTENDIIHISAKFNDSDEWIEVGTYDLSDSSLNFDQQYVSELTNSRITFKENCTGYRFQTSNTHYYTSIGATPYCRIKNSAYVMEQIDGKDRVTLGNIANVTFTDYNGRDYFVKNMYAEDYIIGVEKRSSIEKTTTSFSNNKIRKYVNVGWKVSANENYMTNDGIKYIPQESGTFYDLLPLGCDLVTSSVLVKTEKGFLSSNAYDVSSEINYNGSGRILLRVHIKEQFEKADLFYSTTYTYENILDYGRALLNSAAYESGNDRLANGLPDNGGDLTEKILMTDLDPDTDAPLFIYGEHTYNIRILTAATSGLTKTVKGTNEDKYVDDTKVKQSGTYSYKLRYATTTYTRAKDMVLFDSLENYEVSGKTSDYHGTLTAVDVTQAESKGIAPVVYLSSLSGIDIDAHHDLDEVISGERVWIRADLFGDIKNARAVAVDLRKDKNGDDYILDRNSSVAVVMYMQAPDEDNTGVNDPTAYNNIFIQDTVTNMLSDTEKAFFIHQEYTEVHFRIMSDVNILKLDSSDHVTPVGGIEFTLSSPSGRTDYDNEFVPVSGTTDRYGKLVFNDIEKGRYILSETAGSDDYLQNIEDMEVIIDGRGNVTIKGIEIDPDEPQIIEDDPRVHTDIEFNKKSLKNRKIVQGAKFALSGTSIYGNDVYEEAFSDEDGHVLFRNIEESDAKGYELREVEAADGYVKSETVYTVLIDDNANYSISEKTAAPDGVDLLEKELDGTYTIFNEPLHSFVLQKVSYMSDDIVLEGAEFHLYGYSDYGHEYDKTDTTNERGQITFDGLEAGTYTLKETAAPEGYILDERERTVTIDRYGDITITDTTTDNMDRFVITNKPNGTVTVIKKWLDKETNESRAAKGIDAIISVSSEAPDSSAYFGYIMYSDRPYSESNPLYTSILSKVTALSNIKSFAPYKGEKAYVTQLIDEGKAVRIDDETTSKQIYAWYEEDTGAVYWWTNAKTAKLSSRSHLIWSGLTKLESIDVSDIDTSEVTDMSRMFNCISLQSLDLSTFDTSNVNNMYCMFGDGGWNSVPVKEIIFGEKFNTSKVTNMSYMFYACTKLTELDLSGFDTSNVIDFQLMFCLCTSLTELDVSAFDTSSAITMNHMFAGRTGNRNSSPNLENIIFGDNFDTSNVTDMCGMFYGCRKLTNLDLSFFKTQNVKNMSYMFMECENLTELDVSNFDTSQVTNMSQMFKGSSALQSITFKNRAPTAKFNTSNVTNMVEMFYGCSSLTELDVSCFDTSSLTTLDGTFRACSKLQRIYGLEGFDTSNVTILRNMFSGDSALEFADVSGFDTSYVTNMSYMFYLCNSLKVIDVSKWNTSKVNNMSYMFSGCSSVEVLDVSGFDTSSVDSSADAYNRVMTNMFENCSQVTVLDVSHFKTREVKRMDNMFYGCSSLVSLDLSSFDTSNVIEMVGMFQGCSSLKTLDLSSFDTSNVTGDLSNNHYAGTGMACMFQGCTSLESVDLSSFNTSKVRSMAYMFYNCKSLKSLDLSSFDTSSVGHTHYMFYHCESLKMLDLSSFSMHSVNEASNMFEGCKSLGDNEEGIGIIFGDNFCMKNATYYNNWHSSSINSMFKDCSSLKKLDLSSFDLNGSINIEYLFSGCTSLESVDLSGLKGEFTILTSMFYGCSSLETIDLSTFSTTDLKGMSNMFKDCSSLKTIYVSDGWSIESLRSIPWNGANVFSGCTSLVGGQNTLYSGDHTGYDYAVIDDADNGKPGYLTRKEVTKKTENAAYIDPRSDSLVLSASKTAIKSFARFEGTDEEFREYIDNGTAVKIDNDLTNYSVYTIFDSSTGAVRWWSDAAKVYPVTNMMWYDLNACTSIDLSGLDFSKLTTTFRMFYNCKALTTLNLGGMDTSNVTSMNNMFENCTSLTSVDISGFDTSKVTYMKQMFYGCTGLTDVDLAGLDVSSLISTKEMFYNCQKLTSVDLGSNFNSSKLRDMSFMFYQCKALEAVDLTMIDTTSAVFLEGMFQNCTKLSAVTLGGKFKLQSAKNINIIFASCSSLESIDLSVTDAQDLECIAGMFSGCSKLSSVVLGGGFRTKKVTDMHSMFANCTSLTNVELDKLDTRSVKNMSYLFSGCNKIESIDMSVLDTPVLEDTSYMFNGCTRLSSVTFGGTFRTDKCENLAYMFNGCNQLRSLDLSSFNTAKNRDMDHMFCGCQKLESITFGSSFNTEKVRNMAYAFYNCRELTQLDLSGFNTKNVRTLQSIFYNTQKMQHIAFGAGFTCDKAENMYGMFESSKIGTGYDEYTLDLSIFNTKSVTDMSKMFSGCTNVTEIKFGGNFDTRNVTTFEEMFKDCTKITGIDLSTFDTAIANTVKSMFNNCNKLEEIKFPDKFSVKNVSDFDSMFANCSSLTSLDLSVFKTFSAVKMGGMFSDCTNLRDIDFGENFSTARVIYMSSMFSGCRALKHDPEGTDTESPDYKPVIDISFMSIPYLNIMSYMFYNCDSITGIELGKVNTAHVRQMQNMFAECDSLTVVDLSKLRTDYCNDMSYMFYNCQNLTELDMSAERFRDTGKNLSSMFNSCKSLTDISELTMNTSGATNLSNLFANCTALTAVDFSNIDTSSATTIAGMFAGCTSLIEPDMSKLDTRNVTDMSSLFWGCSNLEKADLSGFDTRKVTQMQHMFNTCSKLTDVNMTSFDTSAVTNVEQMFLSCSALKELDLSSFDMSSVTNANYMFKWAGNLVTIYVSDKWGMTSEIPSNQMFYKCYAIKGGNGQTYREDIVNARFAHIDTADDPGYLTDIADKPRTTSSSAATVYRSDETNEDVKCTVVKESNEIWTYTYTGLDSSLTYYAWEDEIEGYISSNTDRNPLIVTPGNNTITNTTTDPEYEPPAYGSLTVSKELDAEPDTELTAEDLEKTFTFTVSLTDENGQALSGAVRYPLAESSNTVMFVNGKATVKLKGGESLTITEIPSGYNYLVKEKQAGGFDSSCTDSSGTVQADTQAFVRYVNTKVHTEEEKVSFTIAKIVTGNYETTGERYSFSIMLGGLAANEIYTLSDGTRFRSDSSGSAYVSVRLADRETVTVNELPVGAAYIITESGGNYSAAYKITDANNIGKIANSSGTAQKGSTLSTRKETADQGEDITVTFTNTRDARQNLILKKVVENVSNDNDDEFDFTVEFTNLGAFERVMTDEGGVVERADSNGRLTAYFTLKNGDTLTFLQLPVKAKYRITESESDYLAAYELTNSGTGGTVISPTAQNQVSRKELSTAMETINEGEEITVTFTNRKADHDITVTKLVDMTYGEMEFSRYSRQKFGFIIRLTKLEEGKKYLTQYTYLNSTGQTDGPVVTANSNGSAVLSVQLSHGQSISIRGLPENAVYSVTEEGISGYAASYKISGNEGCVIKQISDENTEAKTALSTANETVDANDRDIRIVFTNTYSASGYTLPDSGMRDKRMEIAAIMILLMLFAAAFVYAEHNERTGKKRSDI